MFGYICLPNILLSDAYLWICVEMFIVARDVINLYIEKDIIEFLSNSDVVPKILYVEIIP